MPYRRFFLRLAPAMLLAALLLLASAACAQTDGLELGIPSTAGCELVHHTGYSLCYDEDHEQAAWVIYKLSRDEVESARASRAGADFAEDPGVSTGSAGLDDYRNSGYDRGHLVPAADMKWGKRAMRECFYMSNIAPQVHEFNAGIWEALENDVRAWAKKLGEVYVAVGPVLRDNLPRLPGSRVAIPELFYKIVLYRDGAEARAIGFVMPNTPVAYQNVRSYVVSVDSVEALTGLNFFSALPLSIEQPAEAAPDTLWWFGQLDPPKSAKSRPRKHR